MRCYCVVGALDGSNVAFVVQMDAQTSRGAVSYDNVGRLL